MSSPNQEHPEPKQRFTGYWIPVELSQMDLTKTEQFLLSMIDSLEGDAPEYCFASNSYLAQKMELSESRISHYITKFKRMGLIEEVCFDGRRRRMRTLKSNWYARIESNPKKELCVVASRQTTRLQEVCMRDSTIASYIEKKIDDDDHACTREEVLRTFDTKGNHKYSDIKAIIEQMRMKKFSDVTIKEALKRTELSTDPISNVLKYVEMVCKQIDAQNAKELVHNPKHKEKTWNNNQKKSKYQTKQSSNQEDSTISKKQSMEYKDNTTAQDMSAHPFQIWPSRLKKPKLQ